MAGAVRARSAPPTRPASRNTNGAPHAAGVIAASAKAAGVDVTEAGRGQFRIVGDAGTIATVIGRLGKGRLLAGGVSGPQRKVEIVIGPAVGSDIAAKHHREGAGDAAHDHVGPKARALLRGLAVREADLKAAGGTIGLDGVVRLLRISRQAIDKKVKDGSLLAVPGPSNRRQYPEFQFCPDGVLPGLRAVLHALPSRNPWFRLNFLVNPDARLGGKRPCDLLMQGRSADVVEAARRVGGMGG